MPEDRTWTPRSALERTNPPRNVQIWNSVFLGEGYRVLLRFDNLISHRVTDQFTHGMQL